jgi:hypothetical protein
MDDNGEIRIPSFGGEGYISHLLPEERALSKEQQAKFERELSLILNEVGEVYERKGALYDQATPLWHHFAFGLVSFATQIFLKATRFVSLLMGKKAVPLIEIDDTLRDLMVYTWYAWAYARMQQREEGE